MGIARHGWVAGNFGKASSRLLTVQFLDSYMKDVQEPWMKELRDSFAAQDLAVGCPLELTLNDDQTASIVSFHNQVADALSDDSSALESKHLRQMRNQILHYTADSLTAFLTTNVSVAQAGWFASSQYSGSGRWLGAPTCELQHPAQMLTDREFHANVRMRLLLQNAVANDAMPLPTRCRCLHPPADLPSEPLHMLDERAHNHAEYHARHNNCRDALIRVLRRLPNVRREDVVKEYELPGQEHLPDADRTRADVLVVCRENPTTVPTRIVFDVAVGNPVAVSYREKHAGHPDNPPGTFFGGAICREIEKRQRYAPFQLGANFVPFAIDATGRLGPAALKFIETAFAITPNTPARKNIATYLQARLSAVCAKANAQIVIRNAHTLARRGTVGGIAVD